MKVYDVVARSLLRSGSRHVFGVMGDANLPIVAAIAALPEMTYVAASHECGGVAMAEGYARAKGTIGVAFVTHGPGLTNSLTAIAEAVRNGTPLVVVTGTTPRGLAHFQEVNVQAAAGLVGAEYVAIRSGKTAQMDVLEALWLATTGCTAVVLDVPSDLLTNDSDEDVDPEQRTLLGPRFSRWLDDESRRPSVRVAHGPPRLEDVEEAAAMVASAKRPVLLAGWGAVVSDAGAAMQTLARLTGAHLATTLRAKGIFAGDPSSVGIVGSLASPAALDVMTSADVIVSFGASLNPDTTYGGDLTAGKKVIVCDVDPARLGRFTAPASFLVGDARETAEALAQLVRELDDEQELAPRKRISASTKGEKVNNSRAVFTPRHILAVLNGKLDSDRTLVTDLGRAAGSAWTSMDVGEARAFLPTVGFGSIGLGLATATGAALARPTTQTVLVTGDGGWAMSFQELSTAIREGLNVVIVVFSDGGYGVEYEKLAMLDFDPVLSQVDWASPVKVGLAMGAEVTQVKTFDELLAVPDRWLRGSGVRLIEACLEPDWLMRQ